MIKKIWNRIRELVERYPVVVAAIVIYLYYLLTSFNLFHHDAKQESFPRGLHVCKGCVEGIVHGIHDRWDGCPHASPFQTVPTGVRLERDENRERMYPRLL